MSDWVIDLIRFSGIIHYTFGIVIIELDTKDIVITMLSAGHFNPPYDKQEIDYLKVNFECRGFISSIMLNEDEIRVLKEIIKNKVIDKLSLH